MEFFVFVFSSGMMMLPDDYHSPSDALDYKQIKTWDLKEDTKVFLFFFWPSKFMYFSWFLIRMAHMQLPDERPVRAPGTSEFVQPGISNLFVIFFFSICFCFFHFFRKKCFFKNLSRYIFYLKKYLLLFSKIERKRGAGRYREQTLLMQKNNFSLSQNYKRPTRELRAPDFGDRPDIRFGNCIWAEWWNQIISLAILMVDNMKDWSKRNKCIFNKIVQTISTSVSRVCHLTSGGFLPTHPPPPFTGFLEKTRGGGELAFISNFL